MRCGVSCFFIHWISLIVTILFQRGYYTYWKLLLVLYLSPVGHFWGSMCIVQHTHHCCLLWKPIGPISYASFDSYVFFFLSSNLSAVRTDTIRVCGCRSMWDFFLKQRTILWKQKKYKNRKGKKNEENDCANGSIQGWIKKTLCDYYFFFVLSFLFFLFTILRVSVFIFIFYCEFSASWSISSSEEKKWCTYSFFSVTSQARSDRFFSFSSSPSSSSSSSSASSCVFFYYGLAWFRRCAVCT